MKRNLWLLAALLLSCACAARIAPPTTAAVGAPDAQKAWANHLSRFVDEKGRMNFRGMAESPSDLETYLAWVAKTSPENAPQSFPTPESKLAYYINTYNAVAMYNIIKSNFPPDLDKVKVTFFYKNRFEIGGRYISLYELENKVIRPMGDPRVHVALNCMARGCPRLPREPFKADVLDAELQASSQYFFDEARNVELLPEKKTV